VDCLSMQQWKEVDCLSMQQWKEVDCLSMQQWKEAGNLDEFDVLLERINYDKILIKQGGLHSVEI